MEKEVIKSFVPSLVADSHQYVTHKGRISLVYPCMVTMQMYEIYCLDGDLFDDTERYETLQQAEKRINKLLT